MARTNTITFRCLVLVFFTFSALPMMSSNQPRYDIQTLIYTLEHKYCGKHVCSHDPSYVPPMCENSTSSIFNETTETFVKVPLPPRPQVIPPCLSCSCSPNCTIYGNCCADKHIGAQYFFDCENIYVTQSTGHRKVDRIIVTKCLPDAPRYSHDLAEKCENGELGYVQDGRFVTSLHPFNTSVTFRNKYCAMCYNVTNYTPWDVYITCQHDLDSSNYTDMNALIRSVKELQHGNCYISSLDKSPANLTPECPWGSHMTSTCNVTGKWQHYNKNIEEACQFYLNPALKYRNIFCALCNGLKEEDLACQHIYPTAPYAPGSIMPFSAILNFDSSDVEVLRGGDPSHPLRRIGKQQEHQCREGDVYDAMSRKCREKYCTLSKDLDNDTCLKLVPAEDYVVTIWKLTVNYTDDIVMPYGIHVPSVGSHVIENLKDLIEKCGFNIVTKSFRDYASIHSQHELIIKETQLKLELRLLTNSSLKWSRERLEDIKTLTMNITWQKQTVAIQVVPVVSLRNITNMLLIRAIAPSLFLPPRRNDSGMYSSVEVPLFFSVSCLMIRLELNEIEYINNSVLIHGTTLLHEDEYFVKDDKYIFICSDALFSKKEVETIEKSLSTGQIVTVICLSCSLLFLFLTLMIYILIKELHTLPGLNLIFLTSSLFIAQALYLFGAGANTNFTICTIFGVLIHYFWLVAFVWMNVSCLHMFRVFTNVFKTLDFAGNERRVMLKYSAFAFGVPLVIVCITISASYITSDYTSFGYGGSTLCFVSSGLISVVAFGVPAGATVITNTVLLIYTVVTLQQSERKHNGQKKSVASDILTFFKLSTITGLSWLFGFLGYILGRKELMYVFTALTAGQGVFIFISFAASRRILKMVRDRARCAGKKRNNLKQFSDITCEKKQTTSGSLQPEQSTTSRL